MKNIMFYILTAGLLLGISGCDDGLDTVGRNLLPSVYMNSDAAVIEITKEGGEAFIEPRLAQIADADTKVTVSVEDFFENYNKINGTKYRMLPIKEYELYEVASPDNVSTDGSLTITIKKDNYSAKVGIRVKPLNEEEYPFGVKYAIPIRITSTSASQILSAKDAVVTFNRPFKTEVAKIKRQYALRVKLAENIPATTEFTVQGQFMFLGWADQNQTTMVVGGYYTRINATGIQVKDGGGDGPATWVAQDLEQGKWYQITFTYKGTDFKVYLNGKLIKTFERTDLKINPGSPFNLFNPQWSYSTNQYVREVRLWNRVISEKEINDGLYLPIDPESDGLIMYLPMNKKSKFNDVTKYENQVIFRKGRNLDSDEIDESTFESSGVEWVDNVKFPAEKLEIETEETQQ